MSCRSPVATADPVYARVTVDYGLITGVRNIVDWLRACSGLLVEFDVVSLDPEWPVGPTGKSVLRWQKTLDGRCARAVLNMGIKRFALARARAYYITAKEEGQEDWYLLGDPLVAGVIRRNLLHDKLIAGRVIACHLEGYPMNRIVAAPGNHTAKALSLGMRELERSEVIGFAPLTLLRFAAQSRSDNGDLNAKTGLFCFDETDLPRLAKMAGEVSTGTLTLRDEADEVIGQADRRAAPNWEKTVRFSTSLPQERERSRSDEISPVVPLPRSWSQT